MTAPPETKTFGAPLSRYIAGKHAPIQKWLWLGDPLPPVKEVQLQLFEVKP